MAQDIIRVLRVLEYVGPRAAVERHLRQAIYGERQFTVRDGTDVKLRGPLLGTVTIKAATVGPVPDIIVEEEP